jgi:hypothetical protein
VRGILQDILPITEGAFLLIKSYASVRSLAGVKMEPSGNLGYCVELRLNSLLPTALNATTPATPTGMPKRKLLREILFRSLLSIPLTPSRTTDLFAGNHYTQPNALGASTG